MEGRWTWHLDRATYQELSSVDVLPGWQLNAATSSQSTAECTSWSGRAVDEVVVYRRDETFWACAFLSLSSKPVSTLTRLRRSSHTLPSPTPWGRSYHHTNGKVLSTFIQTSARVKDRGRPSQLSNKAHGRFQNRRDHGWSPRDVAVSDQPKTVSASVSAADFSSEAFLVVSPGSFACLSVV